MGLASAQVEFGSTALLTACLTELIIDTPQEKKHLLGPVTIAGLPQFTTEAETLQTNTLQKFLIQESFI